MVISSNKYPCIVTLVTDARWQRVFALFSLCVVIFYSCSYYVYGWNDGIEVGVEDSRYTVVRVHTGSGGDKAGVRVGDKVLAVNGQRVQERGKRPFTRPWMREGDVLTYQLRRDGQNLTLPVRLGSLSEDPYLAGVIGAHFLTAGFWAIGLLLTLFALPEDVRTRLIGLMWLLASMAMAAGGGMYISSWGAHSAFMVSWCGLAFAFLTSHLFFPVPSLATRRRLIIHTAALVALVLSTLLVLHEWFIKPYEFEPWGSRIQAAIAWFFFLSVLAGVTLLIRNRFYSKDPDARRQTGILLWGTALAFAPFFALTLLPLLLFGEPFVNGLNTVLFLVLMPLAYAYVIYQRKLLRVDVVINRIVVSFILLLVLLTASLLLMGTIARAFGFPIGGFLFGGVVASFIVLPVTGLRGVVQAKVDQVLYGYHYDFSSVAANFSSRLARTLDRDELIPLLVEDLSQQMAIERAALFLADEDVLVPQYPADEQCTIPLDDELCRVLLDGRVPIRALRLWGVLSLATQTRWQRYDWARLFVPIIFEGRLDGLLILGRRTAGDVYSEPDVRIIETVAQQGALAYANVQLVETLRGLHQQLVRTDEAHRKGIAEELHDTVLQSLFFIKQRLLRNPDQADLVNLVDQSIDVLHRTIRAQRPLLLDQGLRMALLGLVDEMQALAGETPTISWGSNVTGRMGLSDEQVTVLYRIAQEALTNALKYANAQSVTLTLEAEDCGGVRLGIEDDGIGMSLPTLSTLVREHHYGLVSMQERATMIDAQLYITSSLSEGTRITVELAV